MQLPSRKTLRECGLDDVYEILKQNVLDEINDKDICICVMFNGWSSKKGLPYVGIHIAYIKKGLGIHSYSCVVSSPCKAHSRQFDCTCQKRIGDVI